MLLVSEGIFSFFVALIGPSRIYLGDHWASDVLGAYLIGGVLLGIALWIYIKLKEQGIMETERPVHVQNARTRSGHFIENKPRSRISRVIPDGQAEKMVYVVTSR